MHFMTPEQLKITQDEFDGLVKLKDFFREQSNCAVPEADLTSAMSIDDDKIETIVGFSMQFGAAKVTEEGYNCGCAACIGGHLSLVMQGADIGGTCFTRYALVEANKYVSQSEYKSTLGRLFYPRSIANANWDDITPHLAAEAIENTLTTGDAKWREIGQREGFVMRRSDD